MVRVKSSLHGDPAMPLILSAEEQSLLLELAAPIDDARRPGFLGAVERAIEAAAPAAVGIGLVHRIGRAAQRDYFDPPVDTRAGRIGPRGPRG
jgi:hypothetical protein